MIYLEISFESADPAAITVAAGIIAQHIPGGAPIHSDGERGRRLVSSVAIDPAGAMRAELAALAVVVVPEIARLAERAEGGARWHIAIGPVEEESL